MAVTIVALGGSFAQQSTSLAAVRIALEGAADARAHMIPQAWRAIQNGQVLDDSRARQLRALGAEVARAADHFAAGRITSADASRVEAALQPVSDAEVRRAR